MFQNKEMGERRSRNVFIISHCQLPTIKRNTKTLPDFSSENETGKRDYFGGRHFKMKTLNLLLQSVQVLVILQLANIFIGAEIRTIRFTYTAMNCELIFKHLLFCVRIPIVDTAFVFTHCFQ